jgi:hypothetical protein
MVDSGAYYHAAYTTAGVMYVLYAISLVVRHWRVLQRIASLERGDDR